MTRLSILGMSGLSIFLLYSFFLVLPPAGGAARAEDNGGDGVYIVYMGASSSSHSAPRIELTELLKSVNR